MFRANLKNFIRFSNALQYDGLNANTAEVADENGKCNHRCRKVLTDTEVLKVQELHNEKQDSMLKRKFIGYGSRGQANGTRLKRISVIRASSCNHESRTVNALQISNFAMHGLCEVPITPKWIGTKGAYASDNYYCCS